MSTLFKLDHDPVQKPKPRKYQLDAFEAVRFYLEYRSGNPCVVLPTGAGKTILLVMLCEWVCSWGGRVLILAHVKELLQQAADKMNEMSPDLHVGVYSAGLERRDKRAQVTIAGIQSIYQRAGEFEPFDLILIDEAHLIPPDGEGMYRTFLKEARNRNTNIRLVGLTATPYRMSTGNLCGPDELLNAICFEVGVLDLINQGFLSPLTSKHVQDCDTSQLHVRGGEFVADEVSLLMGALETVKIAVGRIIERTQDRKSVLVFCSSVDHAEKVKGEINLFSCVGMLRQTQDDEGCDSECPLCARHLITGTCSCGAVRECPCGAAADGIFATEEIKESKLRSKMVYLCKSCSSGAFESQPERKHIAELITGETPSDERANLLSRFKSNELKYLVNVNVLTTGFDAPNVDCVVLLRPTLSPGLYYQMCGRGFRLHSEKQNCLVLDFGGNIQRHGPINAMRIDSKKSGKAGPPSTKTCPSCQEVVVAGVRTCPDCGHEWPREEQPVKHGAKYGNESIITDGSDESIESPVYEVRYSRHVKKDTTPDHPATLRVDYVTVKGGLIGYGNKNAIISEWVCVEHDPGFALSKAKLWWAARSNDPFPRSAERAVDIGQGGGLAVPIKIWTTPDPKNPKYTKITKVELGPKPDAVPVCDCGGAGCVKCEFDFGEVTNPEIDVDWSSAPF